MRGDEDRIFTMATGAETETRESEANARVASYWAEQFGANRVDQSLWTNNHIVAAHIYRLISGGGQQHWLSWFLNEYLPVNRSFARSLSVCCGDGVHELALANSGRVDFVSGFDISDGAIAKARAAFDEAGIPSESFRFDVTDAADFDAKETFDLMLSVGALHHVSDLEALLRTLAQRLSADGYFVIVEYVGPNRFQWTDRQLEVANRILAALDLRFLRDGTRTELMRPVEEAFIAIDPSEAVRSEDVLRCVEERFTIEYRRNFNGTVMHPLYPLLNAEFTNAGDETFDSIIRLVLTLEDELVTAGVLASDFVFAIARSKEHRPAAEEANGGVRARSAALGYIDVFEGDRIAGWATNGPDTVDPLLANVIVDGQHAATVLCDAFRADLLAAGYGDGRKGFNITLASPLPASRRSIAKLVIADTGQVLATRVRRLT